MATYRYQFGVGGTIRRVEVENDAEAKKRAKTYLGNKARARGDTPPARVSKVQYYGTVGP